MKKIFKNISILSLFLIALSCSDADKEVDGVFDGTTAGGLLRTIEINGTVVQTGVVFNSAPITYGADNTPFTLLLEAQDNKNGDLLERVDVSLAYVNNSEGPIPSTDELFWQSFEASEFSMGPNGYPRLNFATTLGEIRNFFELEESDYSGSDQFLVIFTYVMTDGRKFTYTNSNSNVVGGVYMRSPFKYTLNVVCPITESLAGTHSYNSYNLFRGPGGTSSCGPTTGTVVWGDTATPGLYSTSDFSFGMYGVCWGDPPATSPTARVKWFCSSIVTEGVDFYSDSFTYTMVSVSGAVMTLDWINGYGDRGRVEITRQGNVAWPAIFQD